MPGFCCDVILLGEKQRLTLLKISFKFLVQNVLIESILDGTCGDVQLGHRPQLSLTSYKAELAELASLAGLAVAFVSG